MNFRLLILDDDPDIGRMIGFILRGVGVESRAVSSPDDFLREIDDWSPTHLAIDLVMPEMDGIAVVRLLAARQCRARIIITSGVGSRILDAARRVASEHGLRISGVLPKPFTPTALRTLIVDGAADEPPVDQSKPKPFVVTEEELRRAIDMRQLELFYQPKIVCATGELAGFESLVRWRHPTQGIIPPNRFVGIAERSDLIHAMTNIVLDSATDWLARHPSQTLSLSLNISPRNLVDLDMVDRISRMCEQRGIAPHRLTFELTETSAMKDPVVALGLLTQLRVKNFNLSIDDFGTGFSSMIQLVRLPFSEMKVDKSFVMTATESQESRTIIKSIVDLGHSLGLRVTAEGLEDSGTLEFLNSVGCDMAQGYLIAPPMPSHQVERWIVEWTSTGARAMLLGIGSRHPNE
ncbi:MAG TPA: EAL domain-containing response regulator [Alphaproteobacteria bacterium]|jgi:EAL domain-containing protein (putative c-di-GMP-specific phosphodiesterase class I)|nr:EAL domain-containing response regulator [Alphaproteobacteria bacterium]